MRRRTRGARVFGMVALVLVLGSMVAGCGIASESQYGFDATAPGAAVMEKEVVAEAVYDDEARSNTSLGDAEVERMIIWNADISMTVEDAQDTMDAIQAAVRSLGGYTVNTESWQSNDQLHARLTVRVPAERFEQTMAQLRDMAVEVNHESANSDDVTDQYVDLESRLRHLEAKEAQLLEFLDEAEDTEAALAVYDHVAETQAEIEQVKGRMTYLEKLSAMATITAELRPEDAPVQIIDEGWEPGRTVRNAARALVGTLETLGDILVWVLFYVLPILLLLAVPVILVVWLVRRWRRRKKAMASEEPVDEPAAE
ncbi:DUF4349 domain-containing protein [Chloroflexota bacterium]